MRDIVAEGKLSTLLHYLDAGGDVNAATEGGDTLLRRAVAGGHAAVVDALLKAGADPNACPTERWALPTLMSAAEAGHPSCVELLLNAGADPNVTNREGDSALIVATAKAHSTVVERFVKAGVDLNVRSKDGTSALMTAARKGAFNCVSLLLNGGADPNVMNENGYTALTWATREGQTSVVELLLKAGADPNPKDHKPLHEASSRGDVTAIELLLRAGADPNDADGAGYTWLAWAALRDNPGLVEALLKAGADPTRKDMYGRQVFQIAAENGFSKVIETLKRLGVQELEIQPDRTGTGQSAVNLQPGSVAPRTGVYYCMMCRSGDRALRSAVAGYAAQKGVDSQTLDRLFKSAGIGADEPETRRRFQGGEKLDECRRHGQATGWTLTE